MGLKLLKYGRTLALAALAVGSVFSVGAFADGSGDALVPFKVNVDARIEAVTVTSAGEIVVSDDLYLHAGEQAVLSIPLQKATGVINGAQKGRSGKAAVVRYRAGKVSLSLPAQSYKDAEVSLYALNGKRILQSKVSASNASRNISRRNVVSGVYMLRVKGVDGNVTNSRLTHRSGALDISVAFVGENAASNPARMAKSAAEAEAGSAWYILIYSENNGFLDSVYTLTPASGQNTLQDITLRSTPATGGPYNMVVVLSRGKNATGSGTYGAGAAVAINAGTAPEGREFRQWKSYPTVTFAQETNTTTTFTMPAVSYTYNRPVYVMAVFTLPPGVDSELVGDWQQYSAKNLSTGETEIRDPDEDGIGVVTIQASGAATFTQFRKIGDNAWIEGSEDAGSLSADGSYLYVMTGEFGIEEFKLSYRVSADEFVLINQGCDYYYDEGEETITCYDIEMTYKKVNLADVRSGLGTIYTTDPNIYGHWVLQDGDNEDIGFHDDYFHGYKLQRYFPDIEDNSVEGYWYTVGGKLYLIVEQCDWDSETGESGCSYTSPVELTYSVTGSGAGKTLNINGDTWKEDESYYSQSKSKQSKGKRQAVLLAKKSERDAKSPFLAFPRSKGKR